MSSLGAWLAEWQSLIGAVVGGMMALAVALIVAHSARWREVITAASHVSLEFGKYAAALAALRESIVPGKPFSGQHFVDTMNIVRQRPRFSALLEASMARILPVDDTLSMQLGVVSMLAAFAEREFEQAYRLFESGADPERVRVSLDDALDLSEEAFEAISRSVTRIDVLTHSVVPGARLAGYRLLRLLRQDELNQDKRLKALWARSVRATSTNEA